MSQSQQQQQPQRTSFSEPKRKSVRLAGRPTNSENTNYGRKKTMIAQKSRGSTNPRNSVRKSLEAVETMEARLAELRKEVESLERTEIQTHQSPSLETNDEDVLEDPFAAAPETDRFFGRLMKRRETMKAAKILDHLGMKNVLLDDDDDDQQTFNNEQSKEKDIESMLMVARARKQAEKAEAEVPVSSVDDEEDGEDVFESSNRGFAAKNRQELAELNDQYFLAEFLRQNRMSWISNLHTKHFEGHQELRKIQGRLDSKLMAVNAIMNRHARYLLFLRKGLERQMNQQLGNISSRGWFKTGRGGTVDLTQVMEPFLRGRRQEQQLPRFKRASSAPPSAKKTLTFADAIPMGIVKSPMMRGGQVGRTRSVSRHGTRAIRGVKYKESSSSLDASEEERLIEKKMKALRSINEEDVRSYKISPIPRAVLKMELFDLTRDESILDPGDLRSVFTDSSALEIAPLMDANRRKTLDNSASAIAQNRRFTHIYSLADKNGHSENNMKSLRSEKVLATLRKKIIEMRDDEETVQNRIIKARAAVPRIFSSRWTPSALKKCALDDKELEKIVRKHYYEEKMRRQSLTRVLPSGLSAIPLSQPPAPRYSLPSAQILADTGRDSSGESENGHDMSGEETMYRTGLAFNVDQSANDEQQDLVGDDELDSIFFKTLRGKKSDGIVEEEDDPTAAMSDQQFSTYYLTALHMNPRTLLTGADHGTVQQLPQESKQSKAPLPGLEGDNEAKLFSCQTRLADELAHSKIPLLDIYQTADIDPSLILEIDRPKVEHSLYGLDQGQSVPVWKALKRFPPSPAEAKQHSRLSL